MLARIIDETLGNGLQTIRGFDLVTELVDSIVTDTSGGSSIQDLAYSWNEVGHLTQRQDLRQGLTENFFYDNIHRLTSSTGADPITVTYNVLGNITSKTGVGSYTYHATKKHAVTAAGSLSFGYDANGNATSRNGSSVTWYSWNLPNTISASGSNSSQFFYAPDRSRWKQVASYGGSSETTIYVGGLLEKVTTGSGTSWRHFISGGSGPVALYTRKSSAADELHYLTRDHLGNVDSVTNASGGVEVRLSYDAFGARRNESGWMGAVPSGDMTEVADTTRRGFTFHEMLDNLNLIHMNGRVYDPKVGRFISADPFIPNPGHTQSFNRYAYVLNNPLSRIDPSGFDDRHGGGMVVFSWINGSRDPAGMAVVERRWPSSINLNDAQPSQPSPPDPPNPTPPGPTPEGENPSASTTSCQSDILDCGNGGMLGVGPGEQEAIDLAAGKQGNVDVYELCADDGLLQCRVTEQEERFQGFDYAALGREVGRYKNGMYVAVVIGGGGLLIAGGGEIIVVAKGTIIVGQHAVRITRAGAAAWERLPSHVRNEVARKIVETIAVINGVDTRGMRRTLPQYPRGPSITTPQPAGPASSPATGPIVVQPPRTPTPGT